MLNLFYIATLWMQRWLLYCLSLNALLWVVFIYH